jgi:hypothetical protein
VFKKSKRYDMLFLFHQALSVNYFSLNMNLNFENRKVKQGEEWMDDNCHAVYLD